MDQQEKWKKAMQDIEGNRGLQLSSYYSSQIDRDVKHLGFVFARYKFAAKMMENRTDLDVLELGCNHGIGAQFFRQIAACRKIVGIDFDEDAVDWADANFSGADTIFLKDDFLLKDYRKYIPGGGGGFDAIVSIDVIEHIETRREHDFLRTICINLKQDGFAIIGTPNVTMAPYASEGSRIGHVNLYDQRRLYQCLEKVFQNVFMFGMNDETLHTGFYPMSCYILALCCGKKS